MREYLYRSGIKLDCYFTVEMLTHTEPYGFLDMPTECNLRFSSPDDLARDLERRVKGIRVLRSKENPAVIHIAHQKLQEARNYALEQRVSFTYSGPPVMLEGSLLRDCNVDGFHGRRHYSWHEDSLIYDPSTNLRFVVRESAVRRVLTDHLMLSRMGRLLWYSRAHDTGERLSTQVTFLGRGLHNQLLKKTYDGTSDFSQGEAAFAGLDHDGQNEPGEDPAEGAISFITDRMNASDTRQVRWAMFFLGKRQSERAIPLLLRYVDYRYTTCAVVEEAYPAVRALTQIGKPAAEATFEALLKEHDPLRRELFCKVLTAVKPPRDVVFALLKRISTSRDAAEKERLAAAVKLCELEEKQKRVP